MSNPMKYIKDLEAAGFERQQAEAQVQMVLDVLEGDLVTKSDFALFKEQITNVVKESEYRLMTRMSMMMISVVSIAVAVLTWLTKH